MIECGSSTVHITNLGEFGLGNRQEDLIFDWAKAGPQQFDAGHHVALNDETLRDGLQSPAITDPDVGTKLEILHLMDQMGIETADIGLPGAGGRQREEVEILCQEIAASKLELRPNCAGRTHPDDIKPMVEVCQKTGVAIEAGLFTGASPIRQYTESWSLDDLIQRTRGAISFAVAEGLDVMYVTEDTVRSSPDHLRVLLTAAVEEGAFRVCLCDTVGAAVPQGAFNLVTWVKNLLDELGVDVGIDWHGHRDRGLGMANTLAAVQAGATRVHGTAMGLGERCGNTAIEQVLVNLQLLGLRQDDLTHLPKYVETVSKALGFPVPPNAPVVGRNAFRTATGVHAAALLKARQKGDTWLMDWVYSGVPASNVGRQQEIEVGFMSGASNVIFYLQSRQLPHDSETVEAVLARAKGSKSLLTDEEIQTVVDSLAAAGAA